MSGLLQSLQAMTAQTIAFAGCAPLMNVASKAAGAYPCLPHRVISSILVLSQIVNSLVNDSASVNYPTANNFFIELVASQLVSPWQLRPTSRVGNRVYRII
jgi:hypothetical protein